MPSTASKIPGAPSTNSGAHLTADGERHIPSSVRPDGTVRKEIRIRPGYRPPEDVEVYKNRTAESWKSRGLSGVPGAESKDREEDLSKASAKNAKRREARKRAAQTTFEDGSAAPGLSTGVASEGTTITSAAEAKVHAPAGAQSKTSDPKDDHAQKEKQIRKLRKKLREAQDLQEKKNNGEALLHEQFQKVIRINELTRELDKLGFSADEEEPPTDGDASAT